MNAVSEGESYMKYAINELIKVIKWEDRALRQFLIRAKNLIASDREVYFQNLFTDRKIIIHSFEKNQVISIYQQDKLNEIRVEIKSYKNIKQVNYMENSEEDNYINSSILEVIFNDESIIILDSVKDTNRTHGRYYTDIILSILQQIKEYN